MAKKQSRRCISVSRGTYERLRDYSEASGTPMSQIVERLIESALSAETHKQSAEASYA